MKKFFALLILTIPLMLLFNGCNEPTTPIEDTNLNDQQLEKEGKHYGSQGDIVVANRNSGSAASTARPEALSQSNESTPCFGC